MKLPEKPRTFVIIAVIGLIAWLVVLLVLRKEPLDLSKEEAPLPAIQMPPQAVFGTGYMDGGSIGILIIDPSVDSSDHTAKARVVAIRAYEKAKRVFGY